MTDTVTIPRGEYDALVRDAELWRDVLTWADKSAYKQASEAISQAEDWRTIANLPDYAELERRRHSYEHEPLTPAQIKMRAARPWRLDTEGRHAA